MTRIDLSKANATRLADAFASLAEGFGDSVGTLVDRNLKVQQGDLELVPMPELLDDLQRPCAVLRSTFHADFGGKPLLVLVEVQDAAALAGLLLMSPPEAIEARRQAASLEPSDQEALAEVGTVLATRMGQILDEVSGRSVGLKFKDHAVVQSGGEEPGPADLAEVVCYRFAVGFEEYPEMTIRVLMDPDTAEVINGGSLTESDRDGDRDEALQSIPEAPLRGVLSVYLCSPEPFSVIRRSCRRVGLELERHPPSEVPNPAAHKNGFVLMDIPPGEDRRFDWCKRLKDFEADIKVILIIHRPSRARVLQGFIADADVILGWPLEEAQLSQKLTALLQREEAEAEQQSQSQQ